MMPVRFPVRSSRRYENPTLNCKWQHKPAVIVGVLTDQIDPAWSITICVASSLASLWKFCTVKRTCSSKREVSMVCVALQLSRRIIANRRASHSQWIYRSPTGSFSLGGHCEEATAVCLYLSSSSNTTATLPDLPLAISAYASSAFSSGNLLVTRSSG
jgi:hypothetical protein